MCMISNKFKGLVHTNYETHVLTYHWWYLADGFICCGSICEVLTSLRNYILKIQHQYALTKSCPICLDNPNIFFGNFQETQLKAKFVLWAPQTVVN